MQNLRDNHAIPYVPFPVSAGFPAPIEDFFEEKLNLNELLVTHPATTFYVRVSGESMIDAGILHNDILVVDRQLTAVSGDIVIAVVNNEFTVKRFIKNSSQVELRPENPAYPTIVIKPEMQLQIWGVVVGVVRPLNKSYV